MRRINLLSAKATETNGEIKLRVNDSFFTISYIALGTINYSVKVHDKTEYIYGNQQNGYTRTISIDGNPIKEIATYYRSAVIKNFQCRYSYDLIDYPVKVYEEYNEAGNLVKRINPAKTIHFTISDIRKLIDERGGSRVQEARLAFFPGKKEVWFIRYLSEKEGLSELYINSKTGKVLEEKHNIIIHED